jgi:leucyl aminopeptidase
MSAGAGISCRFGRKEMSKLKWEILGGSKLIPPALIIMDYGSKYASRGTVCLVGKGVTFDTGGLSLKPPGGMEKMKYDMAGSAAVIGTLKAAAGLKLKRHIIGLVPAVENNVSNNPQRPGDIIRMFNGKTVEVLNTDAEGRLILGDALAYAARFKPKTIIDIATLTGMCAATFADQAVGLWERTKSWSAKIKEAGRHRRTLLSFLLGRIRSDDQGKAVRSEKYRRF